MATTPLVYTHIGNRTMRAISSSFDSFKHNQKAGIHTSNKEILQKWIAFHCRSKSGTRITIR